MREAENFAGIRQRVVERMRQLRAERTALQASLDVIEGEMDSLTPVAMAMGIEPEEITEAREPRPGVGGF